MYACLSNSSRVRLSREHGRHDGFQAEVAHPHGLALEKLGYGNLLWTAGRAHEPAAVPTVVPSPREGKISTTLHAALQGIVRHPVRLLGDV